MVDSTCDVPDATLATAGLVLLPFRLKFPDSEYLDRRSGQEFADWMTRLQAAGPGFGVAESLTQDELADILKNHIRSPGPRMIALHVSSWRALLVGKLSRALEALNEDPQWQAQSGRIRLVDSTNVLSGYGAQLIDLLEQRDRGLSALSLVRRAQRNTRNTRTLFVPASLEYIRARAANLIDSRMKPLARLAARVFNRIPVLSIRHESEKIVAHRTGLERAREAMLAKVRETILEQRLLSPHVVVSYAGALSDVNLMPGYQRLVTLAQERGVRVHLARMSVANAIHVGPRALSAGFIALKDADSRLNSQVD